MFFFFLSFAAGVLSVFAACVLPLLPVIVGGSLAAGNRRRTYTIVASLAVSVVAFTLLLKASTALIGIPEELWRYLSGGIIIALGLLILFPKLSVALPGIHLLNKESNKLLGAGYQRGGFWGDILMGAALGPVFASCSPTYFLILATVLPAQPFVGTLYLAAYAAGLSLALLAVAIMGERLIRKLGVTLDPEGRLFKGIGIALIVVGVLVFTGTMRQVETWFVERGFDATFIERYFMGEPAQTSANPRTSFVPTNMKEGLYKKAPELVLPDGYINTEGKPITLAELRGKVVLLDIWTYSCINCQRTFPYLKDWYAKYKEQGFEIIGIHTPEFAFEKVRANVEKAAKEFGLTYPIVQDNQYQTWRALGNQFWPRKYLIDIDGYIVYDHAGEGNYDEAEKAIQTALAERAVRLNLNLATFSPEVKPPEIIAIDPNKVGSPETYFGASRNEYLGNGLPGKTGGQMLMEPIRVDPNTLYLIGSWNIMPEYAETAEDVGSPSIGSDRIDYRYRAKSVYFVAGSANGTSIKVEVLRDSKPLERGFAGADVHFEDGRSYITVSGNRLYKVIEDSEYGDHFLELIISKPGFQAYAFTFG